MGKIFALYSLISLPCISHHWLSFKKSQLGTAPAGVSRSYSNVQNNKRSKPKRRKFGLSFFILCTRMVFCHSSVHRACSHSTGRASPPECFQLPSALGSSCQRSGGPVARRQRWEEDTVKAIHLFCSHLSLSYTPKGWADFPAWLRSTRNNAVQKVYAFCTSCFSRTIIELLANYNAFFFCFMNNWPCARNQKKSISFI